MFDENINDTIPQKRHYYIGDIEVLAEIHDIDILDSYLVTQ